MHMLVYICYCCRSFSWYRVAYLTMMVVIVTMKTGFHYWNPVVKVFIFLVTVDYQWWASPYKYVCFRVSCCVISPFNVVMVLCMHMACLTHVTCGICGPLTTVMLYGHIKYEEEMTNDMLKMIHYASGGWDIMLTNIGKCYSRDPHIIPA